MKQPAGSMEVILPVSKSECNRLLVIAALVGKGLPEYEGECEDIADMRRCIERALQEGRCYVKESGTALRFLTALFAAMAPYGKDTLIGCGGRLARRPLEPLVRELENLGMSAPVLQKGEEGEKLMWIKSSFLKGGRLSVSTSVSTQFASALLLIAPYMQRDLLLNLTGKNMFSPYIDMTVRLMRACGARVSMMEETGEKIIIVEKGEYSATCEPEADWSAASFFYEYVAVNGGSVLLRGLHDPDLSLQGDSKVAGIFRFFGVITTCTDEGVRIERKETPESKNFRYDMRETPDLVMPVVAACCFLGIQFIIDGIASLRHKESDRLSSVCEAMSDMGFSVREEEGSILKWDGERCMNLRKNFVVRDASDHRVAMAVEAADKVFRAEHPECVGKSFPDFYNQLNKLY